MANERSNGNQPTPRGSGVTLRGDRAAVEGQPEVAADVGGGGEGEITRCRSISERARAIARELAEATEPDDEPTGVIHLKNQVKRWELERLGR